MGWKICFAQELVVIVFISLHYFAYGLTNPGDVTAINSLHAAFGSPKLPGWVDTGGDPCTEAWQGVQCDSTNIISITLVGANLGGGLGNNLGSFSSIKSIDFSNNHIGGRIPSSLPVSLQSLFLSDNNFTGTIPSTLSSLTNLSTLKLNQNHLTGELPDAYQSLSALSSIDLASNKLSGKLPPSMKYLSSLSSLHLQDNQLSGTLDVLQDLPLQDLNIENNQFSGPIPDKLLNIPNFRRDGNPFNTSGPPDTPMLSPPTSSTKPSPPTSSTKPSPPKPSPISQGEPAQSPFHSGSETPGQTPAKQAGPPSTQQEPHTQKKTQSSKTKKIVGISIASMFGFIILTLALLLCMPRCFSRSREYYLSTRRNEIRPYLGAREDLQDNASLSRLNNRIEEAQVDPSLAIKDMPQAEVRRIAAVPKPQNEQEPYSQMAPPLRKLDSELSFGDIYLMPPPPPFPPQSPPRSPPPRPRPQPRPPPPPPPPPSFSAEKAIVKPLTSVEAVSARPTTRTLPLTSVKFFTIASLQQYTNSFSQDNLFGSGMLGSVYRAELPDGKLLAVKKLDKGISSRQKDHEFIELINDIDRIRHVNIVQLVGYCAEHRQRLLIYEYCNNGTLQDALHSDDEFKKHLSWTTRMRMALGAARALEYLHDSCEPAVVHRNFKSANILLDDELNVRLSDCGLASLIASGSVSQLSGHLLSTYGYGAPEFESGIYTKQSDVYSFGVVMLELLTGRMSYERTRIRGEQFLVRWAVPQLHDIDALHRMVDPSLNGQYPTKSLSHFADIISRCVQPEPEFRPLMSEVVQDIYQMLLRGSPPQGSPAQGSPPQGSFRE